MKLLENQAKETVNKPSNAKAIETGKEYESELRIYTEEKFKEDLIREKAWTDFQHFMKNILSSDKFVRIQDFIKYPLPVVNIGTGVLKDINKVFDSMNSHFSVEYYSKTGRAQSEKLLEELNIREWIERKAVQVLKNKPNSVVVVDKDLQGKPYPLLIPLDRIVDLEVRHDSSLEYISFVHSVRKSEDGTKEVRYSVYDDEFYRVLLKVDDSDLVIESEVAHGLDYCPARMFLNESLSSEDRVNRKCPLSPVLSQLKEWQQFEVFGYYTDHYAAFPVIEKPEENCSVEGCENGKVYKEIIDEEGNTDTRVHDCHVCADKKPIGPGTIIDVPSRFDKDDVDNSGIFKFINPSTENNKYIQDKKKGLEAEINLKVVGENEVLKVQAVNEAQVEVSFEAKKTILTSWKKQLDLIYKWTVETVIKLNNPKTKFVVHADFGTEFYLMSEGDLQKLYENAIKAGLPIAEIDMVFNQLVETKYKNNPAKMQRMKIMRYLDPDPHNTIEKSLAKFQAGLITKEDLRIKSNLLKLVDQFELDNGSIVDFGTDIEFNKKIATIKQSLKSYINEQFKDEAEQVDERNKQVEGA